MEEEDEFSSDLECTAANVTIVIRAELSDGFDGLVAKRVGRKGFADGG